MRELYIFVTTDRPDQYLNPVVHCIEEGVRKVVFVQVEDPRIIQIQLNLLITNVRNLIKDLSTGFYKYYTEPFEGTVVKLEPEYNPSMLAKLQARYSLCLTDNVVWEFKRVSYLSLRTYISAISQRKDIAVDITAVTKTYVGDLFACCLLEGIDKLYTFEVKPNFKKPWKTLIHDLEKINVYEEGRTYEEGKTYRYVNLVETPIFKDSSRSILIRTTPLLISVVGTSLFLTIAFVTAFIFGFNSIIIQVMGMVGTVLGITSFFLVYFPLRTK